MAALACKCQTDAPDAVMAAKQLERPYLPHRPLRVGGLGQMPDTVLTVFFAAFPHSGGLLRPLLTRFCPARCPLWRRFWAISPRFPPFWRCSIVFLRCFDPTLAGKQGPGLGPEPVSQTKCVKTPQKHYANQPKCGKRGEIAQNRRQSVEDGGQKRGKMAEVAQPECGKAAKRPLVRCRPI